MITLFIDDKKFSISEAYCNGALAQRSGQGRHSNPHALTDHHHGQWYSGFENEQAMLHIIDNVDLITSTEPSSRVFSVTARSTKESAGARLKYALDLMRASGMLEQSKQIFTDRGPQSPGDLMTALRGNGHALSRIFAELIIERMRIERDMKGAALTTKEAEIVENIGDNIGKFLLGLSVLQERYYDRAPSTELLSAYFRKPSRWAVQVARVMKREKQGFLVEIGHNRIKLSAKGWAAVELLRSKDADLFHVHARSLAA